MSEVRLVVREERRNWSGTIHGSCADRAVAALSADPVTLDELEAAVGRFEKRDPRYRFFSNLSPGLDDEPYDAGLVVIDLVARLVTVDSTYSSPGKEGNIQYHDGKCATDIWLRYHLADDWQFTQDGYNWGAMSDRLRRERAAKRVFDARAVFYGRPLVEFIARETFAAFARRDAIAAAARAERVEMARKRLADEANLAPEQVDARLLTDEQVNPQTWPGEEHYAGMFYDTLREIHAAWLLTPRDDLGGECPRSIAQERRNHLTWDLQDRCEYWSLLKRCPPGLDESSHAFRYGGFGVHELVVYYDLVRELLWSNWNRLAEMAGLPRVGERADSLTVGDFLTTEVPRLTSVAESWLDEPNREFQGRTPRSVIMRERARIPEGVSGREAMHDPDCPCCQILADMPGPAFWGLDGSNMDDDFAFDIWHRTREEWEQEQRRHEEYSRRFNEERAERERLGVTDSNRGEDGSNSVWSRSFSVGDAVEVPLGVRVFQIGCRLAEVIVGLRGEFERATTPPETQQQIDQLNRDFGNLGEILQTADMSLAAALIDPVVDRFGETLATIAAARPELAEDCESLTDDLRTPVDPPAPESTWDSGDLGLPY